MEKLTQVIAVGYNSWGKGKSVEEALRQWQKSQGRFHGGKMRINLRAVSEDGHIDEMGNLYAKRIEVLPDLYFEKADYEAIFMGRSILMDLIHGYEISDRIYDLKESEIEDEF